LICPFCSQWNPDNKLRCCFCSNRFDDQQDATATGRPAYERNTGGPVVQPIPSSLEQPGRPARRFVSVDFGGKQLEAVLVGAGVVIILILFLVRC
jgi:hypothetical protein